MNDRTLRVRHGSLELNIPRSIFVAGGTEFNGSADGYFSMLRERYPWLSENSVAVLKRNTKNEMGRLIGEGMRGAGMARKLSAEGRDMDAVRHLESHLVGDPEDGDAWYALGEILCRLGRNEEGYRMMNHGRRFF